MMTLGELIERLKQADPRKIVPMGFHNPHSYRGYYDELAFEPAEYISVGDMLENAESAVGKTLEGWKGGDFKMTNDTHIWLAEEGTTGESIGPVLLAYMLGEYSQ